MAQTTCAAPDEKGAYRVFVLDGQDSGATADIQSLRRAPSEIVPEAEGSKPLSFPRLVQPVLDRNCVACHEKEKPKALDLARGDWHKNQNGWYT